MPFPRAAGLLLHPTSLPGGQGIGDLGQAALDFVDFMADTGQQLWQMLPLGPTGYGNSPYMCYSAMAGNPVLISLDKLVQGGWLEAAAVSALQFPAHDWVDYDGVIPAKLALLQKAAQVFKEKATPEDHAKFRQFCQAMAFWLPTYALYMALKDEQENQPWYEWEPGLAWRNPEAITAAEARLAPQVFSYQFQQFIFFQQWSRLRAYANQKGIKMIGDIPIYVAHDSADVWAFPHLFELVPQSPQAVPTVTGDTESPEKLSPKPGLVAQMAGVPPDYFSETGQLWGNPIYNWQAMEQEGYRWWIERFRVLFDCMDLIRVDHFRGFEAYWQVPQGEETAIKGEWVKGPGAKLFEVVQAELGELPILAEDLGEITPEVIELRDQFAFPGMKILQFAFGGGADNPFLPFNYERNFLVYTGTHDNNTTVGWFAELGEWEQNRIRDYLGAMTHEGIHWDLIRLAFSSVANQAIIPVQDLLGLGTPARMNFPSKPEGNWAWRLRPEEFQDLQGGLGQRLKYLTQLYGRYPSPPPETGATATESDNNGI
ncbi:4-alpha-glucanotransferase [Synechococcus sp. PCC 6312]|uniref:4-alpha-glucanotransferase n=1 Tax=Synechococcus sp. (strain ATCC 27167 / PCC 6312) TaxID=195253 RepID=UPI00029F02FB|nr:4-alpha-glucanotransferase [Synechococcus sp. PCC 6312]AFY60971.1 4-alpha-glucanotransferase [Synechococcus sp. PCC 6312]